ncbi:MAG: hypothetical protein JWQ81_707 [Amycolatopsis sp.]|uniref:hypothetical protein n=1 Tax=Amycolatopsis sp. TaxID=37632 RepID=UPI00261764BE|nr:hypothetical protein [Amycolatopsis sp.]MCU1679968.1 hypothetical protein [Amycolatopsis sp.]
MTRTPMKQVSWIDTIDMVAAVRGSGRGFMVLVCGGLGAPALAMHTQLGGSMLLLGSAILAFVVAAVKPGQASNGGLHGAVAAVGAYLLVLPLVLMASAGRDPAQISMTLAAAVIIGAAAGWADVRRRQRKTA